MRRRNGRTILAALAAAVLQACADGSCGDGTNCAVIDPDAGALKDVVTDLGTKPDVADASDVVDAPFDCARAGAGTVCAAGLRCNAAGRCRCGDGRLDEGEQCDDGRNEPGSGCEPDCRYSCSEARPCAPTGGVCADSDVCDVRTHRCVAGLPRPGGTRCGENRVCDGTGSCVDCADEGRACETARPCARAAISCASGRPECVFAGNLPVGTPCGASAVCTGNGRCDACAEGATCASTTACRTAVTRCATGVPVCTDTGNVAPGTACGANRVCDRDGACVTCDDGTTCMSATPCRTAVIRCGSGAAVCTDTGNAPAGSSCGEGRVCDVDGTCNACVEGASCAAATCRVASITCASGRPVCRETGNAPAGTACGANQVCNAAGACVACADGIACSPESPACRTGVIRCATGAPVCVATGNAAPGSACGTNRVCGPAGDCVACTEGAACSAGNACVAGVTRCATGTPVCAPSANLPAGTACPGGVCNGAGACVPCTPGAACSTGNACTRGVIVCASGGPVCATTGNAPALTACPGGVCNGAGTCVRCGDGFIDRGVGEICDDGNTADGDGCSSTCRSVECGLGSRRYEDPATHTCYWRDPNVTGRSNAVASCASARGYLAIFESQGELDAVYPAMGLGGSNRVWIGLQRRTAWLWDNNVPLSYTGFRSGEPSGDGTCVEWGPANNFNDVGCSNSRDFVCERPAPGAPR